MNILMENKNENFSFFIKRYKESISRRPNLYMSRKKINFVK